MGGGFSSPFYYVVYVADTKKKNTTFFHARSRSRKEGRGESDRFSPIERRREHFDDDASVVIQQKRSSKSQRAALKTTPFLSTNGRKDVLFFDAFCAREIY